MEIFIHIPFVKKELQGHIVLTILKDLKLGIYYVTKENQKIFKVIILAAALNLFMSPFLIIGVPYILRITMQSSETMYGIGIGEFSTILGALLVGVISKKMSLSTLHRLLFLTAILGLPMAVAVTPAMLNLGYWPSFSLFFTFAALIMMLVTIISIFVITSVQLETPDEMLGKVMAIIMAVSQCAAPLGQALYGMLFEGFNAQVYIPILLSCLFTTIIAFVAKRLIGTPRRMKKAADAN